MTGIIGLGIGIVLALSGYTALELSDFLTQVEDETKCLQCQEETVCFGRKEIKPLHTNRLTMWMLVSFVKLRKRCEWMSVRPVKDRITAFVLFLLVYLFLFWSKGMDEMAIILGIASAALLYLSIVDWKTQYIPLEMSGIILMCGLIHLSADFSNWLEYIIGLIAVSGFLLLVDLIATPILRKRYEGQMEIDMVIGDGDIILMAATGLLLGWKLNILALGIGCIAGSVIHLILMKVKASGRQFALGPYLSLGVYITMICGEQLVSWYLNLMGGKPL